MGIENTQQENISIIGKESLPFSNFNTRNSPHIKNIPPLPNLNVSVPPKPASLNGYSSLLVDGKEVYRGLWKEGRFHGRGKLSFLKWIYDG
jgi:hypothetical protein